MDVLLTGFLTGLSLIVAIGAQNAYVLRQGLARNHIFLVVLICAVSDALLIFLGIGGFGTVIRQMPLVLEILRVVGVGYLLLFAIRSAVSAFKTEVLLPSEAEPKSAWAVAIAVLGLTYLNPHVYLDTVLFLGTLGAQFGDSRWLFGAGAAAASVLWFCTIGFGARAASKLMARPIFWRVLDLAIAAVMLAIAFSLAFTDLS